MSAENIALGHRWFNEVWNQKNPRIARELLASDAVMHGISETGADVRGPEEFLKLHSTLLGAFPDMQFQIHDCFGSGDLIAIRWTASMRHTGEGLGLQPTGAEIKITGIGIARIQNGQVVETWDNWDRLAFFQQLDAAANAKSAQA